MKDLYLCRYKRNKMKNGVLSFLIYSILFVSFVSCNKGIPEEDKNAIKEELEARKIKRVTPQEIMTSAEEKGRIIAQYLTDLKIDPSTMSGDFMDSLNTLYQVQTRFISMEENTSHRDSLEKQIIDTFIYSETEDLQALDQIIQLDNKDLLYTKPVVKDSAGVSYIKGIWAIEISRKRIIQDF